MNPEVKPKTAMDDPTSLPNGAPLPAPGTPTRPGAGGRADFSLERDAWGRLVLTGADGVAHVGVQPVPNFPLSDPRRHVSICDGRGKELVWIEDMDRLPEPLRRAIDDDLSRRTFVPVIRRIIRVSALAEPAEWEVETERGRTTFLLKSDDDVRRLDDHRAMVVDAQGMRYLIPDLPALDARSRTILDRYL